MKAETGKDAFTPVVLTLETQAEVDLLFHLSNAPRTRVLDDYCSGHGMDHVARGLMAQEKSKLYRVIRHYCVELR